MKKNRRNHNLAVRKRDWRTVIGDGLILAGVLLIFTMSLFWVRSALAAFETDSQAYLVSEIDLAPPLPVITQAPTPASPGITETDQISPTASPELTASGLPFLTETTEVLPITSTVDLLPTASPISPTPGSGVDGLLPTPSPGDLSISPTAPVTETVSIPTPAPSAGPIVRLVIPRLSVDRAVVPVELRRETGGTLQWNTDALFSTQNRPDLVGQLAVSPNPGEGGNIVLIGHNYNNGWYDWEGVFVRLQNMQPGDEILLYTQNGGEFRYQVQKVKKVPWLRRDQQELEKHQRFLWPTDHEQLTLVTCGGVNMWTWQARIYVVALPIEVIAP